MRTLRIYSLNSFPTNHTSVLPIVTMLYVTSLELTVLLEVCTF